ncbi:MAG: DUF5067 domain-containing protein [Lachnospiraceae bacterium]|nr:DUF5067 domain-containing protein [Lachnospiraceae bacterium]
MPRDLDLDFEFQDEELRERPVRQSRPAPRREGSGRGPGRGVAPARRRKNDMTSIIILAVEIVVFIALIALFFFLKGKIVDSDSSGSAQASESSEGGTSDGVNVESDDFSLTCTKVQLVMDADNNTAAVVYFTFVNKTQTPLAMSEVFPASVKQNGTECPEDTNLTDVPVEVGNKDMQISGGQSAECAYAFLLSDQTSPLTLTIRDNYSTFQDIGSTEIPIS